MDMAGLISNFLGGAVGTGIVASIALLFIKRYLSAYVAEKGKNLATKEDIGVITREVEGVRHEFSVLLEQMKARHQLRLAALDKRLQVHQEAFIHWRELFTSEPETMDAVAQKCRDWWNLNCLYLEPEVRQAFLDAVSQEWRRRALQRTGQITTMDALTDHLGKMFAFPDLLFDVIKLPPLSETERRELKAGETTGGGPGTGSAGAST